MKTDLSLSDIFAAALKQFGAGIAVAAVFAFATARIYSDLERRNDAVLLLVEKQVRAESDLANALNRLTEELRDGR